MKKLMYVVGDIPDWINIISNLEKRMKWKPTYVLTPENNEEIFKGVFPNIVFHGRKNAINGEFPNEFDYSKNYLDKHFFDSILYHKHIAIKMMGRHRSLRKFLYEDRFHLFENIANKFINVIIDLDIDSIVFAGPPHDVGSYILYAVSKYLDLNVLILRATVSNFVFITDSVDSSETHFKNQYSQLIENIHRVDDNHIKIKDCALSRRIDEIKNLSYHEAEPEYMIKQREREKKQRSILQLFNEKIKNYKKFKVNNNLKLNIALVKKIQQKVVYNIWAKKFKRKLKREYIERTGNIDYTNKYIYVALHYQPERTTSPDGGYFVNQLLMVKMLSEVIPDDWLVYVKEHNSQFLNIMSGELGREIAFYDELENIDNVIMVPLSTSSFDLIDNSQAVATVTGTVGYEAVLRGIPSLIFGYAWYRGCEGVFYTPTFKNLIKALRKIQSEYKIDQKKVLAYFSVLENHAYKVYWSYKEKENVNIDFQENVNRITQALTEFSLK